MMCAPPSGRARRRRDYRIACGKPSRDGFAHPLRSAGDENAFAREFT
jgi:hypothetical protein